MSGFFELLLDAAGFYYVERLKNPLIMDPLMIPEKYPSEQTVNDSLTNESQYKRRARRRRTRRRLKPTHRSIELET